MDEPPSVLRVETTRGDGQVVLAVSGELDLGSAARFDGAAGAVVAVGLPVVVDLGGVTFVDSSGLRSLLALRAAAGGARTGLRIVNVPPIVTRAMRAAGVAELFD